jgi:pimeloyl-ACP methyl ester carboxylesterase
MAMTDHAYKTFEDQYVQVGETRIRYWSAGRQGPPVLLVHALGASVEYWGRVIAPLARTHRVYAIDLPGFGLSDKPDAEYGEAYLAAAIRGFLDAVGLPRVTLVGNSMGGAVSLRFAREAPDQLDRLVLVCAGGLGYAISPRVRMLSVPGVGELLSRPRPEFTRRLVKGCVADKRSVPRALLETSEAHSRTPGAQRAFLRTLRRGIRWDGQRPAIVRAHRAFFPRLRAPTLVLWGAKDRIVPADYLEEIRQIPDVQVHRLECGHYPQLEAPGELCHAVLRFLEDCRPAAAGAVVASAR